MFLFSKKNEFKKIDTLNEGKYIAFTNVSLGYDKNIILRDINLNINFGEKKFIGLVGKNGSGKTTLINSCLGLISPLDGSIRVSKKNTSYVPDTDFLWGDLSVENCISIFNKLDNTDWSAILESYLDISSLSGQLIKDLSFGQNKRVQLFFSLMNRPSFLVLDEPFIGLDRYQKEKILCLFAELKKHLTILASFHEKIQNPELIDEYILIKDKKVIRVEKSETDIFSLI